jgi:hypothetical protein
MIRYFAICLTENYTPEKPSGLFREVKSTNEYTLEYFNTESLNWIEDNELVRYFMGEEMDATEITSELAEKLVADWSSKGPIKANKVEEE